MIWDSFSFSRVDSLLPIGGMMSSDKQIDVIERKIIPVMTMVFPDGRGIFQHDLAPCPSRKQVILMKHKLNVLDWKTWKLVRY